MRYLLLLFFIFASLSSCGQDESTTVVPASPQETGKTSTSTLIILDENTPATLSDKTDKWYGFILDQTDEESTLFYSEKKVLTWPHRPPVNVPFRWNDACPMLLEKFESLPPGEQSFGRQRAWESLKPDEQKRCIKEALMVTVEPYNARFYKIERSYAEDFDLWLYDISSNHLQRFGTDGLGNMIKKISLTASGIEVTAGSIDGLSPDMTVMYDPSFKEMIPTNNENHSP